jgi:hypothetical protein
LTTSSDPRGDRKGGIDLKQTSRRLTCLGIASKMGQSGRQAAGIWRIGWVLTKSLLGNRDCLIETAKLDQCQTHARKSYIMHGVQRAQANAAFKAPDCFFVLASKFVGPSLLSATR